MTGDTAQEAWTAFMASVSVDQAARDRETGLTPVEARMLANLRRNQS